MLIIILVVYAANKLPQNRILNSLNFLCHSSKGRKSGHSFSASEGSKSGSRNT